MENQTVLQDNQTDKPQDVIDRRGFSKKALSAGFLSAVSVFSLPRAVSAWMDGTFQQRDDLADAFKVLVRTYSHTDPYPHKFHDGLVRLLLRDIDFFVRQGKDKQFVDHYVHVLGSLVDMYIRRGIERFGKDIFLWGIFERTTCSYQLYETINVSDGQRTFPCPYKSILEHIRGSMGTYKIEWKDVCAKWCIPVWTGFANKAGVEIEAAPGEVCSVKVK